MASATESDISDYEKLREMNMKRNALALVERVARAQRMGQAVAALVQGGAVHGALAVEQRQAVRCALGDPGNRKSDVHVMSAR